MNTRATAANLAWLASCLPAYQRFRHALHDPGAAQSAWLQRHLARNRDSAYGRAHGIERISNYREFARRVPLVTYAELEPWLQRAQRGERSVLVREPVTRLVPTSGSTGARKLIPFTRTLQQEFNAAVGPWMIDLARRVPTIAFGPAYWSVTPMGTASDAADAHSAIPVGFDDDSEYLGGARAWLVEAAMAVPSTTRHIPDLDQFRRTVLLHLLARPDLRLISIWHPSFLALLLDTLVRDWDLLRTQLGTMQSPRGSRLLARCDQLKVADPMRPLTVWPHLRVVSCWADAHAAGPAADLARRLPGVQLQPKGLLATEGCVTVPFGGQHPVALTSHFFEFIAEDGSVHPLENLRAGTVYEVAITTGGGLWRYRLGDRVEVSGFVGQTPSLRFLSRAGNVSDRCGEKLSEAFAIRILATLAGDASFAMLAAEPVGGVWRYVLHVHAVQSIAPDSGQLDAALSANPHYALCRRLGQLCAPRIVPVDAGAYARFAAAEVARGMRLGDIKPVALSLRTDWAQHLEGGCTQLTSTATPE